MTPVTIALIIIILGYVHHDRLLTLAGSLFLPVTLWLAIHNLRMGLLPTGIILVACGTIALLGYFAFRFWAFAEVADEQQMDLSLGVTTDA